MKENMFEKDKLLKVKDVASTFNKHFGSITEFLKVARRYFNIIRE